MSRLEILLDDKNFNEALREIKRRVDSGETPLDIHYELYSYVQYVTNPPYINPHLPKMHRICREFYQYLTLEDAKKLLDLEIREYIRRDRFTPPGKYRGMPHHSLEELKQAIENNDRDRTANILAAIGFFEGKTKLSNIVMSLCGGYMESSLGHSVSCTTFILLEYLDRKHDSEWHTYAVLADYLCKGGFFKESEYLKVNYPNTAIDDSILRAVSGTGIENLHDTITIYAIQKSKPFVGEELYNHLVGSWLNYLGEKNVEPIDILDLTSSDLNTVDFNDYEVFQQIFLQNDAKDLTTYSSRFIGSAEGRRILTSFLIKGVVDAYDGRVNPHQLTGLGSLIWVLDNFYTRREVCHTALYQYLDFTLGLARE